MNNQLKGVIAALLSAFLFGIGPSLGRISFLGGSNAVMLTMLRAALALPVLLAILFWLRIPVGITRREVKELLILGSFGVTLSTAMYYQSLHYIPSGQATVLNCTYPFFVVLYSLFFMREKVTRTIVLSMIAALMGVFLFTDLEGGGTAFGYAIVLLSSVAYAFVMIYQYRCSLHAMHPLKLSFWLCIITTIEMSAYAMLTDQFTLALTPAAWGTTFVVAIGTSVAALSLLQYSLQFIGPTPSSVLTLIEPIVSVVLGVLLLGETVTWLKVIGIALVLVSVTVLSIRTGQEEDAQTSA